MNYWMIPHARGVLAKDEVYSFPGYKVRSSEPSREELVLMIMMKSILTKRKYFNIRVPDARQFENGFLLAAYYNDGEGVPTHKDDD